MFLLLMTGNGHLMTKYLCLTTGFSRLATVFNPLSTNVLPLPTGISLPVTVINPSPTDIDSCLAFIDFQGFLTNLWIMFSTCFSPQWKGTVSKINS